MKRILLILAACAGLAGTARASTHTIVMRTDSWERVDGDIDHPVDFVPDSKMYADQYFLIEPKERTVKRTREPLLDNFKVKNVRVRVKNSQLCKDADWAQAGSFEILVSTCEGLRWNGKFGKEQRTCWESEKALQREIGGYLYWNSPKGNAVLKELEAIVNKPPEEKP